MNWQKLSDSAENTARVITPSDLVGSTGVAQILGITVASVVRRVQRGSLAPLARLDGRGAYVFDRNDIEAEAKK